LAKRPRKIPTPDIFPGMGLDEEIGLEAAAQQSLADWRKKPVGRGTHRGLFNQLVSAFEKNPKKVMEEIAEDIPGQLSLDDIYANPLNAGTRNLDAPASLNSPYYGVNTAGRPIGPAAAVGSISGYGTDAVGEMLDPPSAVAPSRPMSSMADRRARKATEMADVMGPRRDTRPRANYGKSPSLQARAAANAGTAAPSAASTAGKMRGALKWGGRAVAALAVLDLMNRAYQGTVGADNDVKAAAAGEALQAIPEMEFASSLQQEQEIASFLSQTDRNRQMASIPHLSEMSPDTMPLITERIDELSAISARQAPSLAELALRAGVSL
jgi:hypothetical protein